MSKRVVKFFVNTDVIVLGRTNRPIAVYRPTVNLVTKKVAARPKPLTNNIKDCEPPKNDTSTTQVKFYYIVLN